MGFLDSDGGSFSAKQDKKKGNKRIFDELFDALESNTAISNITKDDNTMKKFNASDLSKKPSQVFAEARGGGAIIQHKDRQGKVVEEFVIMKRVESPKQPVR